MVTNGDKIITTTSTPTTISKTPKFMTPFKAHQMSYTPQQKGVNTPVSVWRRGWKKLGMSSTTVPFCYSNHNNSTSNKSVNDSGIGSSLPDQPLTTTAGTVEEQEEINKQFEVTDTQMESFFATQGSVSSVMGHHDDSGVIRPQHGTLSMMRSGDVQRISLTSMTGCVRPGRYTRHQVVCLYSNI